MAIQLQDPGDDVTVCHRPNSRVKIKTAVQFHLANEKSV
jgi:hypothetical protein